MNFLVKLAILMSSCLIVKIDGFYVTSRPVQESPRLTSLISLVTSDIDYRYTDNIKRLTAIKDKSLQSCFVTGFDPQWNLYKSDKESIARRKPFDVVRNTNDFVKLRSKAGKVIAHMCKRAKIFWMNENQNTPPQNGLLPPPMLISSGSDKPLLQPLPLLLGASDKAQAPPPLLPIAPADNAQAPPALLPIAPADNAQAPPPLLPIAPADNAQAPPPQLPIVPVAQVNNKEAMQEPPMIPVGHHDVNIQTPPPLAVWRQMQAQNKQTQEPPLLINGPDDTKEPPKIQPSEGLAPPVLPGGELIEPPKTQIDNIAPPKLAEPPSADFHAPPQPRSVNLKEPLPDFRTPPSPFTTGHGH